MNDCLASTGIDGAALAVLSLVGLAALAVGAVLALRGRRGAASTLMILLLVLAGATGIAVAAPTAASAACPAEVAPVTPPVAPALANVAGTWEGVYSGLGSYFMEVALTDDGSTAAATVVYTNAPSGTPLCGATWTQTSRTATSIIFLETVDNLSCFDNGTVTITPVGDPATELGFLIEVPDASQSVILSPLP